MLVDMRTASPAALLGRREDPAAARATASVAEPGWMLLGGMGAAFALIGGLDLALTWYPFNLGNPEWEFGTVTSTLDGMPVYALGLALLLAAGAAGRRPWVVRGAAVLVLLTVLAILAAAFLYATTIPMALKGVENPLMRLGLQKAILKTAAQALVYPVALAWIAVGAWRHAARG